MYLKELAGEIMRPEFYRACAEREGLNYNDFLPGERVALQNRVKKQIERVHDELGIQA